jgi:hypothetical protein
MFSAQYINSIHICKGNQGKFYVLDGIKYDINFPLVWALDHHNYEPYYDEETNETYINGSGPNECDNCNEEGIGSMNGVFIGYCSSCLEHVYHGKRGDYSVCPGLSIAIWLSDSYLWKKYPYMTGVKFEEIGHNIEVDEERQKAEERKAEELKERKADEQRKADEECKADEQLKADEGYNKYKEDFEKDFKKMDLEDEEERYREERYEIQLEKFKDMCCRDR